ncbi:type I CRISPR-associated protein Cas7 [Polycladospora coralii]|uniref:type I CRISPR-associated protein Cas7 n=1 Tax=Polycladospora coralii TaxID=2771432 RepID=UPI0020BED793|nr:type I CRISPR-associated protein Cas7 [Polycladospora coralii]
MEKRVYGLVGVGSYMSNWNADFTGRPKSISDGGIFGSDKALKYSVKNYWVQLGEKVLYYKSFIIPKKGDDKEKLQPRDLIERYHEIFETELTDKTSSKEVLKHLFSAVDVLNFGATFAVKKQNISLTGVVQIGQGHNKYEESEVEVQDILSPFRNSKKGNADASSLGKKIVSNEAHYLYPFSVNPHHYDEYIPLIEGFEGYTVEAYEKLREGFLRGATALNTNSKAGCENEFALFVTCVAGSRLYLPQLDAYVKVTQADNGKVTYDCDALSSFLESVQTEIESIELFYNPYRIHVTHMPDFITTRHLYTNEVLT